MSERSRFVLGAALVSGAMIAGASCWNFDEALAACLDAGGNCRADAGSNSPGDAGSDGGTDDGGVDESDAGNCGQPLCLLNRFETPSKHGLHAVWGAAPNDVWLGGGYETTVRWDGRRFDAGTGGVYDQYAILDLWGTSSSNIWAVGGVGLVLRWDGTKWATVNDRPYWTTTTITSVWTNDPDTAWTNGEHLWAVHPDGGATSVDPSGNYSSIWGTPAGHAWAVGGNASSAAIVAERVRGAWTPAVILDAGTLYSVSGNADNNVWAVGEYSTVLHLTDAGWAKVPGPSPSMHLLDVWVSPSGDVWATTDSVNGSKVAWRNVSGSWSVFTPPGTGGAPLEQVFGFDNGDIWFVGGVELPSGYYDGGFAFRYRRGQ